MDEHCGYRQEACRKAFPVVAVIVAAALGLTGCASLLKDAAKKAVDHFVPGAAKVNAFTGKIKVNTGPYVVTYVTTGSAPATVEYAASPPHDIAFVTTPHTGSAFEVIQNASGGLACTQGGPGGAWSCTKIAGTSVSTYNAAEVLYSGAYWAKFLEVYAVANAATHNVITSSQKTVNGFSLQCINAKGSGSSATSTVCITAQGIIGYVSVSSTSTAFEIKSYSSSPASSLFVPPPGATITTLPTVTTSPGSS